MKTRISKSNGIKKLLASILTFVMAFSVFAIPASASTLFAYHKSVSESTVVPASDAERYYKVWATTKALPNQTFSDQVLTYYSGDSALRYYWIYGFTATVSFPSGSSGIYSVRRGSTSTDCGGW